MVEPLSAKSIHRCGLVVIIPVYCGAVGHLGTTETIVLIYLHFEIYVASIVRAYKAAVYKGCVVQLVFELMGQFDLHQLIQNT